MRNNMKRKLARNFGGEWFWDTRQGFWWRANGWTARRTGPTEVTVYDDLGKQAATLRA